MKIAIASDNQKDISSHFGRTRGFVIYEVEDEKILNQEYRLNTFTDHTQGHEHGEEHRYNHGPILEALKDCNIVISNGMGRRIYEDLKTKGIDVIVTNETDVNKALNLYINNELDDNPDRCCCH